MGVLGIHTDTQAPTKDFLTKVVERVWGVGLEPVFSAGMGGDADTSDPILLLEQEFSTYFPCHPCKKPFLIIAPSHLLP